MAGALAEIGTQVEPSPTCVITPGAEGAHAANTRRIAIQVTDQLGQKWPLGPGRWKVWVFIAASADGAPSGSGNTVSFNAGTVLSTVIPSGEYEVLATTGGLIEMDVALAGVGTRHIYAHPIRYVVGSGAVAWA